MRQSSAKPADGASNATGSAAIFVQTSHSASGSGTCAYWIGRRTAPVLQGRLRGCLEAQLEKARMAEEALYDGFKRAEPQAVAR